MAPSATAISPSVVVAVAAVGWPVGPNFDSTVGVHIGVSINILVSVVVIE